MKDAGGSEDMTLAFELTALRSLANPSTVFANTRQWTSYTGIVSEEPTHALTNYARSRRIRQDFFSGPDGKAGTLEKVKSQFESERYVFVGTDEDDRELAESVGWEYLDVREAADAADWELRDEEAEAESGREDWP
ncbi:DUF7124 domain-containing protein [Halanaeroarchaeum sulfurireducens]|uniref:DUF7124 domain-containing protein n=1 Tax=Halanaeroarchaeum sulfurireducens TaxID=1604004 RepID=A0A0F7PGB9_9EURY|nr:hypothetical protein [Halanaeroarchaeum sulfurireducens]AKH98343.1 hypothetical protein HLASF_1872 [Halanaeroarchaeum sulfurireducens]ALG82737.1 hypothetical protein HLASA_1858 [Halanaeroarchaeum sulfurireducens]